MTKEKFYIRGDLAEYTGKSEVLHGARFYEFTYLEGHRKGKTEVTQRAPKEGARIQADLQANTDKANRAAERNAAQALKDQATSHMVWGVL